MTTFTASEVRTESCKQGRLHRQPASDMLNAFADRLEADDKAVPLAWLIEYDFNPASAIVTNSKAVVDGLRSERNRIAPLYTHPADAERLAEALRSIKKDLEVCDWTCEFCGHDFTMTETGIYLECTEALASHSAQAQPPAASVTDAMVERALSAYYVRDIDSAGFAWEDAVGDPRIAESDMRAALEAALAAQENPNG